MQYLCKGLAEVQKITPANDFYDPAFAFLSNGMERLFKVMLCLNYKQLEGELPTPGKLWGRKNGHDIVYFKSKIEEICIPLEVAFAKGDYELITQDETINSICKVLSEYGQKARYFNLDVVLGREQEFNSKTEWQDLKVEVLKEYYGEEKFSGLIQKPECLEKIYLKANKILVSKIELFLRAITRQFVLGNFSSESKLYAFDINTFLAIDDADIGTIEYYK